MYMICEDGNGDRYRRKLDDVAKVQGGAPLDIGYHVEDVVHQRTHPCALVVGSGSGGGGNDGDGGGGGGGGGCGGGGGGGGGGSSNLCT